MRHAVFGRKLGRDTNSRKALLNNLAGKLIIHGSINTTLAKAKFVKPYVEKMVTDAKKERLALQRVLASHLPKAAFKRLSEEIAPGFKKRAGGYTRIVKLAVRRGDSAPMARIELVEWELIKTIVAKTKKTKTIKKTKVKANSVPKKTSSEGVKAQKKKIK